jgi:hypothetical protein
MKIWWKRIEDNDGMHVTIFSGSWVAPIGAAEDDDYLPSVPRAMPPVAFADRQTHH